MAQLRFGSETRFLVTLDLGQGTNDLLPVIFSDFETVIFWKHPNFYHFMGFRDRK